MNLLELMLEKNIVWPAAAKFAAQDKSDYVIHFYRVEPDPVKSLEWRLSENEGAWANRPKHLLDGLASDWDTRIVTRKEYQAAGGWMGWEGGNRPVPKETSIKYLTRKGDTEFAKAGACNWKHVGDDSDIIAYYLTAIIPGSSSNDAEEALTRLYTKLGVTTLEAAFAVIDEWVPTSVGHTIVRGETIFRDCTIVLQTEKSVVWVHNKEEYITPLAEVLIDPSQDELTAYLLSGLCGAQIAPVHIAEVRDQVHWVYRENQ